jgi:hypothetical protein
MTISKTGNNLAVVININKGPFKPWMAFCSWYSIIKNLPDAKVFVLARRDFIESDVVSSWAKRCKIEFSQYNNESYLNPLKEEFRKNFEKTLFIHPGVMAVDTYLGDEITSSKSDEQSTFVSYLDGVGNFVLAECINKNVLPLGSVSQKFISSRMSVNESRIIKLWEKAEALYKATF